MKSTSRKSGMNVDPKDLAVVEAKLPQKTFTDPTRAQLITAIRDTLTKLKAKPTIVLVILSNGDKHVYSGLKHLCDCYLDPGQFNLQFLHLSLKNLFG